jgi:hypothetical protein
VTTCCFRFAPGSSTTTWRMWSPAGTPPSPAYPAPRSLPA